VLFLLRYSKTINASGARKKQCTGTRIDRKRRRACCNGQLGSKLCKGGGDALEEPQCQAKKRGSEISGNLNIWQNAATLSLASCSFVLLLSTPFSVKYSPVRHARVRERENG
jgi:hypothetical protein